MLQFMVLLIEEEREFVCKWLFYTDMNLILCLAILNPESKLPSDLKKKEKYFAYKKYGRQKANLSPSLSCLSLSGSIWTPAALLQH